MNGENAYPITIAYDIKLRRIGCALLQRSFGGTIDNFRLQHFNNWLLDPTEHLKLMTINSQAEFDFAVKITNKENKVL